MKASRNFRIGTAAASSDIVTLKITLASPTYPSTNFAQMKYNKKSGVMMVKDDGATEDYSVGYAYLKGGIQAKDGVTYPGVTFTDGASKVMSYKLTSAINTNSDANNPANGRTSWINRKIMLDTVGWEMANHSYDHGYYDRYRDVKLAEKIIWDNTGLRTRAFVVPTNDEGYANTALSLGYGIIGTQGAFDDFQDHRFTNDGYGVYWGGQLDVTTFNYKKLLFNRYYAGEGGQNDLADMYTLVDSVLASAKNGTGKNMAHWFHHGLEDAGNPGHFEYWKTLIQYIKNHPDNNDSMWITGMQEFTEYYETKDLVVKSESTVGNLLTVTLNLSNVPKENRLRDMSLLLTGGNISSIQVDGANSFTYNPSTGLINLYVSNSAVKSPYSDTAPPQLIAVTKSGNNVLLTYDRAVTQSVFSNTYGNAYTVSGNTILSVTGSGVNWSVNCQSAVANGATLDYRMQRGNAMGTDGMKVCSYIGYLIA